jgi:DNA replication protein DnaC
MEILTTKTFTCRRCGQEFLSKVLTMPMEFLGRPPLVINTNICDSCGRQIEQEECDAARAATERRRALAKQAREEAWSTFCPKEYRLTTEDGGATGIVQLEMATPRLKEVLAWKFAPQGLIIRGETGKCKTRAMWRLLRKLWLDDLRLAALTAGQFDRQCRDAGGNFTLTKWFDNLARSDVFFLDDLGKASWTPATEATWFDLVDERTREHRPILVTTNDTGQSLAARMSENRAEPLVRRLRDYCQSIEFA